MAGGRRQDRDEQALTGWRAGGAGPAASQHSGQAVMEPDTKYRNKKSEGKEATVRLWTRFHGRGQG